MIGTGRKVVLKLSPIFSIVLYALYKLERNGYKFQAPLLQIQLMF